MPLESTYATELLTMVLLALGLSAATYGVADKGPAYFLVCTWIVMAILGMGFASILKDFAETPLRFSSAVVSRQGAEPSKLSVETPKRIPPRILERHRQRAEGYRTMAMVAWGAFALSIAIGALGGRWAGCNRLRKGVAAPVKVSDIEGFVGMLLAACDDADIKKAHQLLELPDTRRKDALRILIDDLRAKRAPSHLIDAFICLRDDAVAEKAYVAIYQCWNKPGFGGPKLA